MKRLQLSLALCLFMVGLDGGVVNVILPRLQELFGVSMAQSTLLATVYIAILAAFQLFFGRLADLFGAARVYFVGIVIFGLGSLGCAMSASLPLMLAARAFQGLGGAMLSASFGAVILQNFPKEQRGRVIGTAMLFISLGALVGPPVGGMLATHASWHWAFLINLPGCLLAAWAMSPAVATKATSPWRGRLDLPGSVLSAIVLLTLPAGLHNLSLSAEQRGSALMLLGLGVLSSLLFVWVEARASEPLVEVSLFRDRSLLALFALKVVLFGALNGVSLIFPFFIASRPGLGVSQAGWLMLFSAVAMAVMTPLTGRQVDRRGPYLVLMCSGVAIATAAAASLTMGAVPPSWALALSLAGLGASFAVGMVGSSVAILEGARPGQEGIFSALNSVVSPIGGALGLSIFSLVYGSDDGPVQDVSGFRNSLFTVVGCGLVICILAKAYHFTRTKAAPHHGDSYEPQQLSAEHTATTDLV